MDEAQHLANQKVKRKARARDASWMREKMESRKGLTDGEVVNGWTEPELKKYIAERDRAVDRLHGLNGQDDGPHLDRLYKTVNDGYDPHGW